MGERTANADAPSTSGGAGNILIVDDTAANLRLLTHMLTEQGYHARPVLNGTQALAAVQAMPPDLILLDIRMPGMSGYDVCQRLKQDAHTRSIPVLFISALSDTDDKVKAFAAGAVDYITKPFQLEEVLARVQTHLTVRNLQRHLEAEIVERDGLIADLKAYAHTVAHELRSPLAGALGAAQLLADPATVMPDDERRAFVGMMIDSLQKANGIVKELLLLAELRQAAVASKPLEMGPIVASALARVAAEAELAGARIAQPASWPAASGYAPWVEEIWVNYLTNAIKYGGAPPLVTLGAEPMDDGQARFWVSDKGDGLSRAQQSLLFAPFTRLDLTHATGYGLGLSIVQRIVQKLGGQAGVVSSGIPGEGCTFFFILPGVAAGSSVQ